MTAECKTWLKNRNSQANKVEWRSTTEDTKIKLKFEEREKKTLEKISSILERVLRGHDLGIKGKQYQIWEVWDDVVGAHIARHAQPHQIRNAVLWVTVSSSTWMQQLEFTKQTIRERLNDKIGEDVIKTIRFKMGELPHPDNKNDKTDRFPGRPPDNETE